jgi:hypothetical protein
MWFSMAHIKRCLNSLSCISHVFIGAQHIAPATRDVGGKDEINQEHKHEADEPGDEPLLELVHHDDSDTDSEWGDIELALTDSLIGNLHVHMLVTFHKQRYMCAHACACAYVRILVCICILIVT